MAEAATGKRSNKAHSAYKPKVLFFSTGDAVRSQMAEGIFRRMTGEDLEGRARRSGRSRILWRRR